MTRPAVRVRIAFTVGAEAGLPTDELYTDVTAYVRSITIRSGRNSDLDRMEASTATVELEDGDARFTPGNPLSPYAGNVLPFRQLQIHYQRGDSSWSPLFTGYIQSWVPNPRPGVEKGGTITLPCVDYFRILSDNFRTVEDTFGVETAGDRMASVMSSIFLPISTDIDPDGVMLSARTVSSTALTYLQEIAQVDGGLFRARQDGYLEFVSRHTLQARERWMLPVLTLGEDQGAGEIGYQSPSGGLDEKEIINYVTGAAAEGAPITPVEDEQSQISYLVRPYDFGTTYQEDQAELEARAADLIHARAEPGFRWDSITIPVHSSEVDADDTLGVDLFDRVEIVRRPASGVEIRGEYHVQGVTHEIGLVAWSLTWQVAVAPDPYWILGVSTLGENTNVGV